MKIKFQESNVSAALGILLSIGMSSVYAIERPVQIESKVKEQPKQAPAKPQLQQEGENEKLEPLIVDRGEPFDFDKERVEKIIPIIEDEVAWLGVGGAPVSRTLATHLGIDYGLVLRAISPESPAANAGFNEHDVLMQVDGLNLTRQEDLRHIVESKKPGDAIKVTYLHRGEEITKDVVLGKKTSMPAAVRQPLGQALPFQLQEFLDQGDLGGMMEKMQERMENFESDFFGDSSDPHERIRQMLDQVGGGAFKGVFQQHGTFKLMDGEGSVEMSTNNGQKEVSVTDREGNVLYSGPFETDEDKAAMSDDVRRRVEGMSFDTGGGIIDHNFFGK